MIVWSMRLLEAPKLCRQSARVAAAIRFALASVALVSSATASAADSFRDLQIAYRCELVGRLEQIAAAGDPKVARNRYLAVTVAIRPQIYVQCMFRNVNTIAYCEAASGFYVSKAGEPRRARASERTIAALAQLGFDTDDSAGNFKIDRTVNSPPDFNGLADFVLRTLHDGYGVRSTMELTFNAPFAPNTPTSCLAVS